MMIQRQDIRQIPPPHRTTFVGRERELRELQTFLANPACRLLTLTGPGGIGKTRLALELAARIEPPSDGVAFAALQPVDSVEGAIGAIAAATGVMLVGHTSPHDQLLAALRHRQLVLILDNLEHVLDSINLVADLLEAAPGMRLIVTSREVLNLQDEWVYPVGGLVVPTVGEDGLQASAAQLFAERARRVRHDFSLVSEQDAVRTICRLVEGMPLAIELAAAWAKTLPCAVIAGEIERNLAFLETNLRDLPERHRSMRATFDYSWHLLSERERDVFVRLAVFRSGFTREAAEQVAGANLGILATLLDKSLARMDLHGRYHIHELLRQYAEEHLQVIPATAAVVAAAHGAFVVHMLDTQFERLLGGEQADAVGVIAVELANIRAAWPVAVEQAHGEPWRRAAHALRLFCLYRALYLEGIGLLELAAERLHSRASGPSDQAARADMLVGMGWLHLPIGRFARAEALFKESEATYQLLEIPPPAGIATDPLLGRAMVAIHRGEYAAAAQLANAARQQSEAHQQVNNLPYAWFVLTNAAFAQGHNRAALEAAEHAYAAARRVKDHWLMGFCLCDQGNIAYELGDYAQARRCYQASYELRRTSNDPQMAWSLLLLGRAALAEGDYEAAHDLHHHSLRVYRQIGDHINVVWSLAGLGRTAYASGDPSQARHTFAEALALAAEMQYLAALPVLFTNVAELLLAQANRIGPELLVLVLRHPANDRWTNDRAQQLLLQFETALAPDVFAAALARGQTGSLEGMLPRLLHELEHQGLPERIAGRVEQPQVAQAEQPRSTGLVFDVAARELVVDGERVGLSNLEWGVLRYLSEREGKAVPRGDLLEDVWGYSYEGGSNVVDVVVRALRKKLGPYAYTIETVTKVGYRFRLVDGRPRR